MRTGKIRFAWGLLFFWVLSVHAQVTTGTILGTVTDTTGAIMPGTSLVIHNDDTGASRTVTTDAAGRYQAPSLSLGNYSVTASLEGFKSEVRTGIAMTVGREAVVDFKLAVGAVSQSVEVTGEAPLVETTEATVSYLVNDKVVRDLPLNGRDLTQLILLNPGVSQAANGTGGSAFNGWGKKVSISGTRSEDSVYLLDGSYVNDMNHHIATGPDGALLGVETVREFQVLTSSFGAQYGRTMGGVFNAVSKSGTNALHGDIFEFLRNSDLDARDFFDVAKAPAPSPVPPFRRNQFGTTVGGPIRKDKIFFFAAYEGMRQQLSSTVTTVVPNAAARTGVLPTGNVAVSPITAPFLALFPLPTPGARDFGNGTAQYLFIAPQPTRDDFGQARIDYQLSAKDSLFGRMTASQSTQSLVVSYPGYLQLPSMGTRLLTLGETHIFSPGLLLTTRFSFNRVFPADGGSYPAVPSSLEAVAGEGAPNLSPGSGVTTLTQYGTPGDHFITNRFTPQGDVTWTIGAHSLQFGGVLERMQFNQNEPSRPNASWTWGSLPAFLQDQLATNFRASPPQLGTYIGYARQLFSGLYLQDDWKVNSKLTLNLGLRWEPYSVPTQTNIQFSNLRYLQDPAPTRGDPLWINKSWGDLGPRLGSAWSPFAGGKTAVRGGFGIMFMPNDPSVYRNVMSRNSSYAPDYSFVDNGHFPNALAELAAFFGSQQTALGYSLNYADMKTPRTMQFNLNVQQQVGQSNMISIGYTGLRGRHQSSNSDIDMPLATFDGTSLAFPVGATRLNPVYAAGSFDYINDNANTWYNALNMSLQRRFAAGFQAQVSYTFSRDVSQSDTSQAMEYSGAGPGSLPYAHDLKADQGLSGFDVKNSFRGSYEYDFPLAKSLTGVSKKLLSGWQSTGIVSIQSGQPFSLTSAGASSITALDSGCCVPNLNLGVPANNIVSGTTAGCPGFTAGRALGTPNLYFNPCAFSFPSAREIGNLGRNVLIGPGLATWDTGLSKETALTERFRLQFRAELFNLLNRANFAKPAASVFSNTGTPVGSAGTISSTIGSAPARQIQLSLKLLF